MNAAMDVDGLEQLKALWLLITGCNSKYSSCNIVPAVNPASEQLQGGTVVVWLWYKTTLRKYNSMHIKGNLTKAACSLPGVVYNGIVAFSLLQPNQALIHLNTA